MAVRVENSAPVTPAPVTLPGIRPLPRRPALGGAGHVVARVARGMAMVMVLAALTSGCGAVRYATRSGDAARALEAAEAAGAPALAPYEYELARALLEKAGEHAAEGNYGVADRYLADAKASAEKAEKRARRKP